MNDVFFHIAKINNYQHIVDEIFSYIMKEHVFEKIDNIFLSILGDKKIPLNIPESNKIKILYESENLNENEFSTLNLIREYSLSHDSNILYVHVKGITSNGLNECINDWRRYMLYFNIEKIEQCLNVLINNVTCGVDLRDKPALHYSGNIWWSKCSHIRKLPRVQDLPTILSERHKCEFWICSLKNEKYYSLWDCGIDVYSRHLYRYEEKNYII